MFPQIKSLLLSLIILLATSSLLHSQTYFTQLPDATGYADQLQAHQLDSLNAAAQRLTDALPAEVQSDFAVYDLGFYRHHTSYEGGIPDIMQEAIDSLSTSYYLIFGREIGEEGELKKVWVEMELPSTEDFCFWEDGTFSHLKFMVELRANAAKDYSGSVNSAIFTAMKEAMEYMEGRVAQLVDCCGSTTARQTCDCGWSFEGIRDFMKNREFFEISATVLPVENQTDTSCICWTEGGLDVIEFPMDSGKVIVSTTVNEIKFSDSLSVSIENLKEILLGIGEATNSKDLSFFGAITDQNIFCNSQEPPIAFRSGSSINYSEIEKELLSSNIGLWFNILHYNGNATITILAKGIDQRLIELAFSEDCLNTSHWHFCAFNNINFGYVPFYNRPDGIVINGANNSKITIKNGLIRHEFHQGRVDFGGEFELDLSQVAIGYEFKAGLSAAAGYGNKTEFCAVRALFLDGDYYGYWYSYIGYEYKYILTTAFQAIGTYGKSYFIAINDDEETFEQTYRPLGFAGEYIAFGSSASFRKIIAGINLDFQYIYATPIPHWTAWSLGVSGQAGPQQGFFLGFSVEGSGGFGDLDLITSEIPTSQRPIRDIAGNWFANTFW